MTDFVSSVSNVRDSVAAIMKITRVELNPSDTAAVAPQFAIAFVGTAWCVVQNRYFVTANHIFNNGQPRNPNDRFSLFFVPGNGAMAFHTPVTGFPLADPVNDMAIIEISTLPSQVSNVPAVPVSFQYPPDGTRVLTYGFPAPEIVDASVDNDGNWMGGNTFLKGHANEGIVAGQYEENGTHKFELNVGWHHGESGGPIFQLLPIAAFALMQSYRGIQSPNGVYAGPRQGRSMVVLRSTLEEFGISVV